MQSRTSAEQAVPTTSAQPLFYSVPAAAQLIGTAPVTLYRAIRNGEFPALRIRGRLIIPARVLDEMISTALAEQAVVDTAAWCVTQTRANAPEAS